MNNLLGTFGIAGANQGPSMTDIIEAYKAEQDAKKKKAEEGKKLPELTSYLPVASEEMLGSWREYMAQARQPQATMGGYEDKLGDTYKAFDWQMPEYNEVAYDPYQFKGPDYAGAARIDDVNDISGVPDEVWDKALATREGRIRKGYADQQRQTMDALKGGRMSAAAQARMLQNLSDSAEDAVGTARAEGDLTRSGQKMQIAQGTQSLQANRALNQASMDTGANQYKAELDKWRQQQDASEAKYASEYGRDDERFKTGLRQGVQEAKAGEHQKVWESEYGKSQDAINIGMQQDQFNADERARTAQMLLSGNQAAQGMVSQAGTAAMNESKVDKNDDYYGGVVDARNTGKPFVYGLK